MGIFSRFKDIVTSNISSMLDHAEDPEKLIRLMLREMEETLVELKAGCAATMAEAAKSRNELDAATGEVARWERRAELALQSGREPMAREALAQKIQAADHVARLQRELAGFDELVGACREDIRLLEERIAGTRDRQRLMAERHSQAQTRKQAREQMRAADSVDTMRRFESLDQRIVRMESEAELAYTPREKDADFHALERESAIDEQLDALRKKLESHKA